MKNGRVLFGYWLHPACEALPELPAERYAELVQSIRDHGLEEAIVTHDQMILDGRHRARACKDAGVEPRFEPWDGRGGDPVTFIALKQIRRDMTDDQRAMWAAEYVLPKEEEKARERQGRRTDLLADPPESSPTPAPTARDRAAKAAGVGSKKIGEAKKVRERSAALADEVKAGTLSLPEAARRATVAEKVEALPEDERERAGAFLNEVMQNNHSAKAVELATNLAEMPPEERVRIYVLNESESPQDKSLALTEAAKLPPMPSPALGILRDAGRALAQALRYLDADPATRAHVEDARKAVAAALSTLKQDAAA